MTSSDRPQWPTRPLIELLESLESGKRPKGGVRRITEGIPSVGGEHLTADGGFDFSNTKYVPADFFAAMTKGRINEKDVLIVKDGATTAKTSFVGEDFPFDEAAVNEHVFICRPGAEIVPEFLFWYLFSDRGQAAVLEHFRGSAQGGINRGFAEGTMIPLPSRDVQQRIASIAADCHQRASDARAAANSARQKVATFRAAVLFAACTGSLTADWRKAHPDIETVEAALADRPNRHGAKHAEAQALLDLGLPELPDSYLVSDIRTASDKLEYGISVALSSERSGLPVLRMGNVQDGELDFADLKYSDSDEAQRLMLEDGDLLFNRTNSPELVGKSAVYRSQDGQPCSFASYLIRVRFSAEVAHPDFVSYWISSAWGRIWARHVKTDGVSQSNINGTKLGGMPIPLPPIDEQKEIVERASKMLRLAKTLDTQVASAESAIRRLSRSVVSSSLARTTPAK